MHRILFGAVFFFLAISLSSANCWAKEAVSVEGTCIQLNDIIGKAKREGSEGLSFHDSMIFLAYREVANGQASIYNLALLSSGYTVPIFPVGIAKPDTYFLKKVITSCKQDTEQTEYQLVVTKTIINVLKQLYPGKQRIQLSFNQLSQQKVQVFSTKRIIGAGKNSCASVMDDLKKNTAKHGVYKSWLSGYLYPYMINRQVSPEQNLEWLDKIFQQTLVRCEDNGEASFAEEAIMSL